MRQMRKIIFALAATLALTPANAAPPEGANPLYKDYYHGLRTKEGWGCCSIADCRTVLVKYVDKRPWVYIDKQTFGSSAPDDWLPVPESAMETYNESPDAPRPQQATACWYADSIRCYSPALTAG